jgi:hypothetical protein
VGAEPAAERCVQQMGRAVVGAHFRSSLGVDAEVDGVAHGDLAGADQRMMGVKPAERLRRVLDLRLEALVAADRPGVADLPAALPVERRLVGQEIGRAHV